MPALAFFLADMPSGTAVRRRSLRQRALVPAGRRQESTRARRLRNGNIAFGHRLDPAKVVEYTMLGADGSVNGRLPPEFRDIHHDVFEKDDGNFLVTVNKVGIDTVEDFIVELDRRTGAIVKTWDLRQVLPRRSTFFADSRDWLHVNAVIHDPRDDSIIVSGQRQGVLQSHRGQSPALDPRPSGWLGRIRAIPARRRAIAGLRLELGTTRSVC